MSTNSVPHFLSPLLPPGERWSMLDHALAYARAGFRVLPLHSVQQGRCTCGSATCKSAGKHPLAQHGCHDATRDKAIIRRWWTQTPHANIGLATGHGLLVVDVDTHHGGCLHALGSLPETLQCRTGHGGYHLFFTYDPTRESFRNNQNGKLGKGIDVRAEGGYVVAAPSTHISGQCYTWMNAQPPVPLPAPLRARLQQPDKRPDRQHEGEVIPEGERNSTLAKLGGAMRWQGLDQEAIEAALQSINRNRCSPPLDTSEVTQIAHSVSRYAPKKNLPSNTMSEVSEVSESQKPLFKRVSEYQAEEVDWLWEKRIPAGKFVLLDGDPGLGKSLITIDVIARVTTGGSMPESQAIPKGGVVLIAPEDGTADTIKPRLEAAGADTTQVIVLNMVPQFDMRTGTLSERPISLPEDILWLQEAIEEIDATFVVIDPVMSVLSSKTDSHRDHDVRRALIQVIQLAEEKHCTIVGVMHLNKGQGNHALSRSGGSIAFVALARSALRVVTDPDDPACGVLVHAKHNLSAKATSLRYEVITDDKQRPFIHWLGPSTHSSEELLGNLLVSDPPSVQEAALLDVLHQSPEALSVREIATQMNQSYDAVVQMVHRKAKQGKVDKVARGLSTYQGNPLYASQALWEAF